MQAELTLKEVLETMNESFSTMQVYLDQKFKNIDDRFERLEKRVTVLEITTSSTKTQIENLIDILRIDGAISSYEASQIVSTKSVV